MQSIHSSINDTFISPGDVPNGSWSARAMLKRERKTTAPSACNVKKRKLNIDCSLKQ